MSKDIEEFVKKNPVLVILEMENIIKIKEIKLLKKEIRENKIKIKFLRENIIK